MYVYDLVNGLTGKRLQRLEPKTVPAWTRRPEVVSTQFVFDVRSRMVDRGGLKIQDNPNYGLHESIVAHRDVIVVSWSEPGAEDVAVAAQVVVSPLAIDEAAGTLTVGTSCVRSVFEYRLIIPMTRYPPTKSVVRFGPTSFQSLTRYVVNQALRDYPDVGDRDGTPGFGLPIDTPEILPGNQSVEYWGYSFKVALEALEDYETEGDLVIDFRPRWAGRNLRWSCEVFGNEERADQIIDLGSTGATNPQASYTASTEDRTKIATMIHQTGKGSEADIRYQRLSDRSPTIMARERLVARPEIETWDELFRATQASYAEAQHVIMQDTVTMAVDETNPAWITPDQLVLGATVQLTVEDSIRHGHTTLRRTLVGWQADGANRIKLELQDLTVDADV